MKANSEEVVQLQVSSYISMKYPNILFNCDLSGIKLTMGQAAKIKKLRSGRGWPDINSPEPKHGYSGIYIEIKSSIDELYNKDGTFKKQIKKVYKNFKGQRILIEKYDHIQEQRDMLQKLTEMGYYAVFACGFDKAKKIIDWYFN